MRQVKYSPALAIHYLSSLPSFHEFHINVSHKEGDIWVPMTTVTHLSLVCPRWGVYAHFPTVFVYNIEQKGKVSHSNRIYIQ